jgi:ketosteroid isomerase-like protein
MSQANVETIRQGFEAFGRGDLEAALAGIDPKVEVHEPADLPDAQVYYGHAGFLAALAKAGEMFDDIRTEPVEFIDAGDQVFVWVRITGKGHGSGARVEMYQAWTYRLREGRVVRSEAYLDRAKALEAVGLRA